MATKKKHRLGSPTRNRLKQAANELDRVSQRMTDEYGSKVTGRVHRLADEFLDDELKAPKRATAKMKATAAKACRLVHVEDWNACVKLQGIIREERASAKSSNSSKRSTLGKHAGHKRSKKGATRKVSPSQQKAWALGAGALKKPRAKTTAQVAQDRAWEKKNEANNAIHRAENKAHATALKKLSRSKAPTGKLAHPAITAIAQRTGLSSHFVFPEIEHGMTFYVYGFKTKSDAARFQKEMDKVGYATTGWPSVFNKHQIAQEFDVAVRGPDYGKRAWAKLVKDRAAAREVQKQEAEYFKRTGRHLNFD
jgi:hypothetical protein